MSRFGQCGPDRGHSVTMEQDYVNAAMAGVLGCHLAYAVSVSNVGVSVRMSDPRLAEDPLCSFTVMNPDTGHDALANVHGGGLRKAPTGKGPHTSCKSSLKRSGAVSKLCLSVSFQNFVQAISPCGRKSFEVLQRPADSGMRQCAAFSGEHSQTGCKAMCPDGRIDRNLKHGNDPVSANCHLKAKGGNALQGRESRPSKRSNKHEAPGRDARDMPQSQGRAMILELDSLVPSRRYSVGVVPSMFEYLGEGHALDKLDLVWDPLGDMPAGVKRAMEQCVPFDRNLHPIVKLHMFTDGTFVDECQTGAWAIAVFGESSVGTHWLGCLSGLCDDAGQSESQGCSSAFTPECMAILHALVVALIAECETCVNYDCKSAAETATIQAATSNQVAQASSSVLHLLYVKKQRTVFKHVKSHSGVPGNELVDRLAKQVLRGHVRMVGADMVPAALADGLFPWLWMALPEIQQDAQWPYVSPADGVFVGSVDHRGAMDCKRPARKRTDSQRHECESERRSRLMPLLTYNAMSMRDAATQVLVEQMMLQNGVIVAGLQETRDQADTVSETPHYKKFHAAGDRGLFGCQLWVAKKSGWRLETLAVRHQSPRLLCVQGMFADIRCAMIVGHAPHSMKEDCVIDEWWEKFRQLLGNLSDCTSPIVFVDANARFTLNAHGEAGPANRNAVHLSQCAHDFGLDMTKHTDCCGREVKTWRGAQGRPAKLDYILVPQAWAPAFVTKGLPERGVALLTGWDHQPLLAEVALHVLDVPSGNRVRIDRRAIKDPQNKEKLREMFQNLPVCPWTMDVDTHVAVVHGRLASQLMEAFPVQTEGPRKPYVSHQTWKLIRGRHATRHKLRYLNDGARRAQCHFIFNAWRHVAHNTCAQLLVERNYHKCRMHAVQVVIQIRQLARQLRVSIQEDKAEHVRRAMSEARGQGPDRFAELTRSVGKQGRRFRAPRVAPILKLEDGSWQSDPAVTLEMLGNHFASRCLLGRSWS